MSKYPTTQGYYVYAHITPDKRYYIGMSQMQPVERWRPSSYKTTALHQFIIQYRWDNIEHHVFIDGLTKHQAELKEDELIMKFRAEGLCINKIRSGGIFRDNPKDYDKQYNKQYKQDNAEAIREYQKQYNAANAEKIKQYRQIHTEAIRELNKQYRQTNAEAIREKKKQYNSTPQGKIYNRVASFNHNHPDLAIETPLEARQKFLDYGYIPLYVKHSDLQPVQTMNQLEIVFV